MSPHADIIGVRSRELSLSDTQNTYTCPSFSFVFMLYNTIKINFEPIRFSRINIINQVRTLKKVSNTHTRIICE